MSNLSLYAIAHEHRSMVDRLMETQDDAVLIADTIEAESYPLEIKAQNVAYAIKNLEATANAIKSAEKEMADRRKAMENRVEHLREYAKTCMEVAGVQKIDCPHFALSIKKNPPAIDVWDEKQIPAKYFVQAPPPPPSIDKKAIKADIEAGVDVPGAQKVQGTRLDIR